MQEFSDLSPFHMRSKLIFDSIYFFIINVILFNIQHILLSLSLLLIVLLLSLLLLLINYITIIVYIIYLKNKCACKFTSVNYGNKSKFRNNIF